MKIDLVIQGDKEKLAVECDGRNRSLKSAEAFASGSASLFLPSRKIWEDCFQHEAHSSRGTPA